MIPMLADGINFGYIAGLGLATLVPLLLFQVGVETWVLSRSLQLPFKGLRYFVLNANLTSLLAGIPTKILNAWIYGRLLPTNLPGYFERYLWVIALGSLIYLVVTVVVEGMCAVSWFRYIGFVIEPKRIWKGMLLANVATYLVLAPLHYYLTRPNQNVRQFDHHTQWTSQATSKVLYSDIENGGLKAMQLDGSKVEKVVPDQVEVRSYLVSSDLSICLYYSSDSSLHYHQRGTEPNTVIRVDWDFFRMSQAAFSPKGQYIAVAQFKSNVVEVVDTFTNQRTRHPLGVKIQESATLVWSTNETTFYATGLGGPEIYSVTIQPEGPLNIHKVSDTNSLPQSICYGRVSDEWVVEYDAWKPIYNKDTCGGLSMRSRRGLDSGLSVYHSNRPDEEKLRLSVNPGLVRFARFQFSDTAFIGDCRECVFQAEDYIYLLDVEARRVGTLARGRYFSLMTPRFQKRL